ncbi:hypothetical protein ACLB2K_007099 [Fragaria x ananassa]
MHIYFLLINRFKQASEAYQVLIDDRKRADDNFRTSSTSFSAYGYGYGYGYSNYKNRRYASASKTSSFENLVRYLTTGAFLLNVSVAGCLALLGGVAVANTGWDALWKICNSGVPYMLFSYFPVFLFFTF